MTDESTEPMTDEATDEVIDEVSHENEGTSRSQQMAEATIVGRAQDGDLIAFEQLVRQYQGPLFRLALRLLGDRGEAEDALQDTMVLVWRKLPGLENPVTFRRWVYQITTRRCLSVLRARTRRQTDAVEPEDLDDLGSPRNPDQGHHADPAAVAEYRAELAGLDAFLRGLPDDQRVCWVLRELHELSYPEIAYAVNVPVSTVRGRIARARHKLMRGMQSWR